MKEANKTRNGLEATLSIVVAMDTLSIRDTRDTDAGLGQVEVQDTTSSDPTAEQAKLLRFKAELLMIKLLWSKM